MMQYHGGRLVTSPDLVVFFVGGASVPAWSNDPAKLGVAMSLLDFLNVLMTNEYIGALAQYSRNGQNISRGSLVSAAFLPTTGDTVLKGDEALERAWFSIYQGDTPAGPDTIVAIISDRPMQLQYIPAPSGSDVSFNDSDIVGVDNFGEHRPLGFVLPDGRTPTLPVVFLSLLQSNLQNQTDNLTISASHEIVEAITNPEANAWYDSDNGHEIADACEKTPSYELNGGFGFSVTPYWAISENRCSSPTGPYARDRSWWIRIELVPDACGLLAVQSEVAHVRLRTILTGQHPSASALDDLEYDWTVIGGTIVGPHRFSDMKGKSSDVGQHLSGPGQFAPFTGGPELFVRMPGSASLVAIFVRVWFSTIGEQSPYVFRSVLPVVPMSQAAAMSIRHAC